ncbi:MAG TPA: CHAD domain-containing protein [Thermoanaerobaculia bacterium]|nr:CHAD domain-containing protein [Thermoanaerobaculia bacterium]
MRTGEGIGAGVRRLAREELHAAREGLVQNADGADRDDAVHRARKRFKRIRALLRLVRDDLGDSYRREDRRYRDLGRMLAVPRDRRVLVETLDRLLERHRDLPAVGAFADLHGQLVERHRQAMQRALERAEADRRLAPQLDAARGAIDGWRIDEDEEAALRSLERGLRRVYRRGRRLLRAGVEAPSTENLHDWRKQVKYLGHHLALLERSSPARIGPLARDLRHLSGLLGEDHDLALLLLSAGDQRGVLEALVRARRRELQEAAFQLGCTLYAERPRAFAAPMVTELRRARAAARRRQLRRRPRASARARADR